MKLHFDRGRGLHQVELEVGLMVLRGDTEVTFDFRGRWDGQPYYFLFCCCSVCMQDNVALLLSMQHSSKIFA